MEGDLVYSVYTIYIHDDISLKWPIKALFSFSFLNLVQANGLDGFVLLFLLSLCVLVFVSDIWYDDSGVWDGGDDDDDVVNEEGCLSPFRVTVLHTVLPQH